MDNNLGKDTTLTRFRAY